MGVQCRTVNVRIILQVIVHENVERVKHGAVRVEDNLRVQLVLVCLQKDILVCFYVEIDQGLLCVENVMRLVVPSEYLVCLDLALELRYV